MSAGPSGSAGPSTAVGPWGPGAQGEQSALHSYLDFLSDDILLPHDPLDNSTLAAVASAQDVADEGLARKRTKREDSGVHEAHGAGWDAGSDETDDDEAGGSKGCKRKGSAAAVHKANREKARRERINDRFTELARLVEPGKEPKTDKLSILGEAIRFVQQVQVENNQLKQLNKFLEEKVGQVEKERAQMLYQMYQMGQLGGLGAMQAAPHMAPLTLMAPTAAAAAQQSMVGTLPVQPPPVQPHSQAPYPQLAQPGQQDAAAQMAAPAGVSAGGPGAVTGAEAGAAAGGAAVQQPGAEHGSQPGMAAMQLGKPAALAAMSSLPVPYWQSMLPQSMLDSRQDSLLRPPVA